MPKNKTVDTKTKTRSEEVPAYRPALKWSAQEYSPRHRWWWFIALGFIGIYLTCFLFLANQWSTAALSFVVTFGLVVFGADKPRRWHYELDGHILSVEGQTRIRPIFFTWDLREFKAVTREQICRRKGEAPYELFVLIGRRRLAWPRDVYLSGKPAVDARILSQFINLMPFGEVSQFQSASRGLQRMARLLGVA